MVRGKLALERIRGGRVEDFGVVSTKVVTENFAGHLADVLQGLVAVGSFKYHDSGTGLTAAAETDSVLENPLALARVVGTQEEGAAANVYRTIATVTYDGDYEITEHGVFNAATGGILMDRSTFAAKTVANGDQLRFTYDYTIDYGD